MMVFFFSSIVVVLKSILLSHIVTGIFFFLLRIIKNYLPVEPYPQVPLTVESENSKISSKKALVLQTLFVQFYLPD